MDFTQLAEVVMGSRMFLGVVLVTGRLGADLIAELRNILRTFVLKNFSI